MSGIAHDADGAGRLLLALSLALMLHVALLLGLSSDWRSFHFPTPRRFDVMLSPPVERSRVPESTATAPELAESALESGVVASASSLESAPPRQEPAPVAPIPPAVPLPPAIEPAPVVAISVPPPPPAPIPLRATPAPSRPVAVTQPTAKPPLTPASKSTKPPANAKVTPPRAIAKSATPAAPTKPPAVVPKPAPAPKPVVVLPKPAKPPKPIAVESFAPTHASAPPTLSTAPKPEPIPPVRRLERPGRNGGTVAPPRPGRLDSTALLDQVASIEGEKQRKESTGVRARRVSLTDTRSAAGFYAAGWALKVTRVGEMNFPDAARRLNLSAGPLLEVAIRADGSLQEARILRSSGNVELDRAARRIVELAAPYPPFPAELRQQIDLLRIESPWRFDPGGRIQAR